MKDPINQISAIDAIKILRQGHALVNYHILQPLNLLQIEDDLPPKLVFERCIIENFEAAAVEFSSSIQLIHSHILNCSFNYTYFVNGATIEHCHFESYLDFTIIDSHIKKYTSDGLKILQA
jgi:hypothetical protein